MNHARLQYDFTDEEYKKLPRWAQGYVSSMRGRIRELESIQRSQVQTDVRFGRNMNDESGYLPHQTTIQIYFDEHTYIEFVKLDSETGIRVNATPSSLIIIPRASNAALLMVQHE